MRRDDIGPRRHRERKSAANFAGLLKPQTESLLGLSQIALRLRLLAKEKLGFKKVEINSRVDNDLI